MLDEKIKENPDKLVENWRNPDGTLKPGHPNLGAGRPKGKTMKEFAREFLMSMSDEKKLEFLNSLSKDIVWRMAEGNPHNSGEFDIGIKPTPLLNVLHNDSNQEDNETK